jgi:hypothetical protein
MYITIKDYTHHGGTTTKLTNIPSGTLVVEEKVLADNPDMEYKTCGIGDDPQFYLSAEIVENSPQFFKELTYDEFLREIAKREVINICEVHLAKGLSPQIIIDFIKEHYFSAVDSAKPEEPVKEFEGILKGLKEIIEDAKSKPVQNPFIGAPYVPLYPNHNQYPTCHCGNDGTKPCWSTACPNQLKITYGTTTTTTGTTTYNQ